MTEINQLDLQNEVLIQASYLYPDLQTIVLEIIRDVIDADEKHAFVSLSEISMNIHDSGINVVVNTNQEFWEPEKLNDTFFNKKESLYYYLYSISESITIRTKAPNSRHYWKLRYGDSPDIDTDTSVWSKGENGLIIEIQNLYFNLPVRNTHFLKKIDKSLVQLETDLKNIFMLYQCTYERNKSIIRFDLTAGVNHITLTKQCWDDSLTTSELLKNSFESLFITRRKLDMMDCVKIKVDNKYYTVEGFITAKGYPSQRYQIVYYNHKQLQLPKKWTQVYFSDIFSQQYGFSSSTYYNAKTVGNIHRTYPIIVLKIKTKLTNQEETDLAESNQRYSRFVELKEAENYKNIRLLIILEAIINQFLKKLNFNNDNANQEIKTEEYFDYYAAKDTSKSVKRKSKVVVSSNAKESEQSLLDNFQTHKENVRDSVLLRSKVPTYALKILDKKLVNKDTKILSINEKEFTAARPLPKRINVSVSALEHCHVLGQVDKKFIMTRLKNGTLLIFDQHAMDERIKLEKFIKEFLYSIKEGILVKESVEIPLSELSDLEKSLLEKYSKNLNNLGILIQMKDFELTLCELPTILFKKLNKDHKYILDGIWKYIFELEDMRKKVISIKKINEDSWWSEWFNIPSIIMDILKSNSCRQALMFGDEIDNPTCQQLIQSLKQCHIPFFCAHGRPSMYPFVYENKVKPQFNSDYCI